MIAFFDDITVGETMDLGTYTFQKDEIIRFAEKYDPQPFHLSEEGAAKTHFGRLCASGWHTASVFMKLFVTKMTAQQSEAREAGVLAARIGPSPGFDDLKWIKPVYVGDTLTYTRTVTGKTESRSRPEWGIVHSDMKAHNQDGTLVFSFKANVFVERRSK
ncbi:MaoC family dehydratase [Roseibium sp. MMSF_3544]|uniref:MaoC family dehydratase n=1 Tax=unclassified Roseibium TaxID=2629323 RepID=UPI00273DF993|nr:MaoC family dehydratase [Roseibium sp. MMSF_3544]